MSFILRAIGYIALGTIVVALWPLALAVGIVMLIIMALTPNKEVAA